MPEPAISKPGEDDESKHREYGELESEGEGYGRGEAKEDEWRTETARSVPKRAS